jgi:hypothetical protein
MFILDKPQNAVTLPYLFRLFSKRRICMRNKLTLSLLLLVILSVTFYIGYDMGSNSNGTFDENKSDNKAHQAIQSLWVTSPKPPLPKITIEGKEIKLIQGSYSWCYSNVCTSTDYAAPTLNDMELTVVTRGSQIETKAPERIKEFTLVNTSDINSDPYSVPVTPGKYLYSIHCSWFLDQGSSDFYFALEVK